MTTLTEQNHMAEFLISEAEHGRNREAGSIVAPAGFNLLSGHVMGIKTADGTYHEYDPTAVDGTENVAGILFEGIGKGETAARTVIARSSQVQQTKLSWFDGASAGQITTGIAALEALGITVRP